MSDTVRAFIAIVPPESICEELRSALLARSSGVRGMRVLPAENIHLTVRFLGSSSRTQIGVITEAIDRIAVDTGPFELKTVGISPFPKRRPVVIAAQLDASPELQALASRVEGAAREAAFEPEARSFRAHMTVARLKRGAPKAEWPEIATHLGFPVRELVLFRSDLDRSGARYSRLHTSTLKGGRYGVA